MEPLPGWLAELERSERIDVELSDERASHTVELTQESMLAATGPCYQGLLRFVQKMCPAGSAPSSCCRIVRATRWVLRRSSPAFPVSV